MLSDLLVKIGFRRLLQILGGMVVLLLAVAFVLGLLSLKRAQEIVSDDFQQQQLILARTAARQIEDGLAFLRRELRILAFSPAIQYLESVAWENRMRISFEELSRLGVIAIVRLKHDSHYAYMLDADGARIRQEDFSTSQEAVWAHEPGNRGRIFFSPVRVEGLEGQKVPIMTMSTPIYQVSVDESHPRPPGAFDGVLFFKIDLSRFTGRYCAPIRSGRTGYCWVLSQDGLFLYHPEREFIGEDAFTARGRRDPAISFAAINEIQKTKMLAGEEGTSTYISGWHRGVIHRMEKFLAYTHAHVEPEEVSLLGTDRDGHKDPPGVRIWPVAVVAPTDEVWGTVSSLYIRQFLIQGVLIFALGLTAVVLIYHERRWGVELQLEVERATADLRRSEERYKSVVENARDLIFLLDDKGSLLSGNNMTARVFGVPAKALPGKNLADFLHSEDVARFQEFVHHVFTTGNTFESKFPVRIRHRLYWLSIHFVPLFGDDGRTVERVLVMARDITDRQRMEEQMFQTEKLASIGTLAAGVAHEVNNPLGIILGFTEILLDRVPPESKEFELLKTIERQGLNCKKIVENLMTYARRPARHDDFTHFNHDLETVVNLTRNTLLTKNIDLELHLAPSLPRVRGDASELQQVFLNVINNAVAAMPKGGKLTIISRLNPYTHQVEAVIADTGCGIPKEIADRVFDPFFTTKKVGEGTGLGLSVSYAIVTKYGGSIRFESRAADDKTPGPTGTTFFISLPPEPEESENFRESRAAN